MGAYLERVSRDNIFLVDWTGKDVGEPAAKIV
jgi:hypothetical protein